jgi:hypothetical protein
LQIGDVPKPLVENSAKKPQHMHSLTARSISKEFREGLKLSMPETSMHPGGSKQTPTDIDTLVKGSSNSNSSENLILTPGSLKNKLAFFEQLTKSP